jgi:ABC-type antimicrobial peptide transport system permease subunit
MDQPSKHFHDMVEKENQSLNSLTFRDYFNVLWGHLAFAFHYVTRDTKKRILGFFIGLITIIIVVFVVSILYNSILKASIVFVKLAENQASEVDFIYYTRFTNTSVIPFLNETDMSKTFAGDSRVAGISPRWILTATVANSMEPWRNTTTILLIIDTEREQELGIGRSWPYRPLGNREAHVRDSVLRAIGVRANRGETMNIRVSLKGLQAAFSGANQAIQQDLDVSPADNPFDPPSDKNNAIPSNIDFNLDPTQMIKAILINSGFDFNKTISVNLTMVVDQLKNAGFDVPPIIEILAKSIGFVNFTGEEMFNLLVQNSTDIMNETNLALETEYTVIDAITYPYGKYPNGLGNVVVLDSKYVMRAVGDSLLENPSFKLLLQLYGNLDAFKHYMRTFNVNQYSLSVVGMFKDRFNTYMKNMNERNQDIIRLTNHMTGLLGVEYPVTIQFPLLFSLDALQFVTLFLDQIFVGVVVMLGILGVILIYALLLSNVEEKTYEYGMLRALGLQKQSLIQIVLTQALYFAIPGIIIGMIGSFLANIIVEYVIRDVIVEANYPLKYTLDIFAVVMPIALGLLIPIVANIVPIRTALSKTLRDSLDIAHQTFSETKVRMIRLEKLGIETWQTGVALCLVSAGFVIYYLIPYSFIFENLPMFFSILNCILLAMLLGLCMIAVVLQPLVESLILNLIVWGPDRKMKTLIKKNLAGHRKRSRKTFLMFSLAIAFVIFASVAFSLQVESITGNLQAFIGADAVLQSMTSSYALPEEKLNPYLDQVIKDGDVHGYAYQSFSLIRQSFMTLSRLGSLSYFQSRRSAVYAISQNYLEVAYNKYFLYKSIDREFDYNYVGGKPDIVDSLYKDAGKALVEGERPGFSPELCITAAKIGLPANATEKLNPSSKYSTYIDVIISEAMIPATSIGLKTPLQMRLFTRNPDTRKATYTEFLCKTRATVYKFPGYFFSSYEPTAQNSPVLITYDSYVKILNASAHSVNYDKYNYDIPKEKLLVRFKTTNETRIVDILNHLKSFTQSDFLNISNMKEMLKSTSKTTTALLGFFNLVAAIAIFLCFFILTLSFTANVRDNSWEFGVLRAVGMSVNQLIRAYIYEALCLVISAVLSGTIIGLTIALTLTAQFNVFLETPWEFNFPYWIFASLSVMAIVVAILGSYIPARVLRKKDIAMVLRGID